MESNDQGEASMTTRTSITLLSIVLALVLVAGLVAVAQEVGTLGADPGTSQVLRSRSNADGKLVADKGNALAGNKINDGRFWVRFPIDVSNCVFSSTLTNKKTIKTRDDPGMITAQLRATDNREVLVTTFNQFGNLNDHAFDLIVACEEPEPEPTT